MASTGIRKVDIFTLRFYTRLSRDQRKLESRLQALKDDQGLQNMLRAHVAYLDHLTALSRAQDVDPVNHRTEFTTWYLQHRPPA
jgi:hypothetical protein